MSTSASSSGRFPELEKYELVEEIGHGGMATVYRARDLRLEREVAVKLIHKHLRENPEVRRRFVAEAKAVAKLRHSAIVEVYDVSDDAEDERYLVVELIRGQSLRQVLQEYGVLPPEVAASIVSLLCGAVEHAHECGVIHRDIKPENVLIERPRPAGADDEDIDDGDNRLSGDAPPRRRSERPSSARSTERGVIVKLTDFGIAKVLDVQGVTSTGQILGSPAHMAPEQIEGGNVGPHTDVFALGVLMYEAMVGHLPFEGKNPAQVLRRVLEGSYEQADSERAEVGGRWSAILARTLDIDIQCRLPSAVDLGTLIDEELAALGVEDARQEIAAFFTAPEVYRDKQRNSVVQRLLRRGEKERRLGHIQEAAADFNRALALRPDDLVILKRVSALTAQTVWRQRAVRLGLIGLGFGALTGSAYGLTRLLSSDPREVQTDSTVQVPDVGIPSGAHPIESAAIAETSSSPSIERSSKPTSGGTDANPSAQPTAKRRSLSFSFRPAGAKVKVNGADFVWFASTMEADVGSRLHLKASAGECCDDVETSVVVKPPPDDKPNEVQKVDTITLPFRPAQVTFRGGELVTCTNGLALQQGDSVAVKMTEVESKITCTFTPGGKQTTVTLRAGGRHTINWPK